VLRNKDKMLITDTKERVIDPLTGKLTERPVINAWMTVEQRKDYFKRKKAQTHRRKSRAVLIVLVVSLATDH
ncbi:hypothetical protein J0673_24340, partial [Vibrio sp. Vb2736]|uniref:hypothetical protein n=1 Tax=Vibrio sp. Vb2736 TaxID=2816075 RepID=UPI001A8D7BD8